MTEHTCEMIAEVSALFRTVMLALVFIDLWNELIERNHDRRKVFPVCGIVIYLLVLDAIGVPAYARYIPVFFVSVIYCTLFKLCKWEKPVFLLLFLYNLHTMTFLIADSFHQLLIKRMDTVLDTNAPDVLEKIFLHTGIAHIVLMILYASILVILYRLFCKMRVKLDEMTVLEFIFLSVLNVVGILLAYMILDLTIVPLDNEVFILYDEAAECLWKIPLIAALLLIGEYSSIFVFCQYKKVLIERERVIAREQQLKQLQYRFEESQLLYGNLRSLRHDMKNHMQTIQGLVAAGESKRASEYVEKLNDAIDGIDCKYCTGNALCDIVLNNKYRQAKKDEIKLSVSFRFVNGISDFDMGIILSNLCDNAIEACRKLPVSDRRIEITLMEKGPCVLLTVTNPYDGKLLFDVGEDLPMSCKQNGSDEKDINNKSKEHGIGLRNVSAIADAYLGNLQIETSDQIFSATVMLQKRNGCPVTT